MTDAPWFASYPSGVPKTITSPAESSLGEFFDGVCERYAEHTAFRGLGQALSYAELHRQAKCFAAYLQAEGFKPGDRIALMMPNVLQYPVALFGTLKAGCVVVNVNPLYTADELTHQLNDAGAKALVVLENFACTVAKAMPNLNSVETVVITEVADGVTGFRRSVLNFLVKKVKRAVPAYTLPQAKRFLDVLGAVDQATYKAPSLTHQDLAFLQYTGGTTGVSKGAMLSHGNILSNVNQAHAWLGKTLVEAEEVVVTALPLYHIFSLTANCMLFMKLGGENLLIVNPRDMKGFMRSLRYNRFTVITGVNTLFNALLKQKAFKRLDFKPLKLSLGGGMAVQSSVAERWQKVTQTRLLEAYGLTETSPAVCINPLHLEFNGSIGLPVPSTEVSILDEQDQPLPLGEHGEIAVRGPQVMQGYWQRPEETQQVMTASGFFKTGDIGYIDAKGFVFLTDRKKDMILVSGFNVYPNEVEDALAKHPGVDEVAAIGVPSEQSGEQVKVCIVKADPKLTAEAVIAHAKEHLTGYKVPKQVEFRESLPKTPVGKILRRALRD